MVMLDLHGDGARRSVALVSALLLIVLSGCIVVFLLGAAIKRSTFGVCPPEYSDEMMDAVDGQVEQLVAATGGEATILDDSGVLTTCAGSDRSVARTIEITIEPGVLDESIERLGWIEVPTVQGSVWQRSVQVAPTESHWMTLSVSEGDSGVHVTLGFFL